MPLVSWNASLLGCLSALKELYCPIIKTLPLICLPWSWKFVPQLFSEPHNSQFQSTNLIKLSTLQANIFSVPSASVWLTKPICEIMV